MKIKFEAKNKYFPSKPTRAQGRSFGRLVKFAFLGFGILIIVYLATPFYLFKVMGQGGAFGTYAPFLPFSIFALVLGAILIAIAGQAYHVFIRHYKKLGRQPPWWLRLHSRLLTGRKLEDVTRVADDKMS